MSKSSWSSELEDKSKSGFSDLKKQIWGRAQTVFRKSQLRNKGQKALSRLVFGNWYPTCWEDRVTGPLSDEYKYKDYKKQRECSWAPGDTKSDSRVSACLSLCVCATCMCTRVCWRAWLWGLWGLEENIRYPVVSLCLILLRQGSSLCLELGWRAVTPSDPSCRYTPQHWDDQPARAWQLSFSIWAGMQTQVLTLVRKVSLPQRQFQVFEEQKRFLLQQLCFAVTEIVFVFWFD